MSRALTFVLLAAIACWMTSAHWQHIDIDKLEAKRALHAQVLENSAPDPYQYKLWILEHGLAKVSAWTGHDMARVWMGNTLLSLLFLVFAHHLWLRQLVGRRDALFGSVLLGALANALFVLYYHHTYEFWGVGLFCLGLVMIERRRPWWQLALLFLVTGLVWEKHALLAPIWGLYALLRREPFVPRFLQGLVLLACALAVPLLVRWHLGDTAHDVDGDSPILGQLVDGAWMKPAWFQLPYILPFLLMLAAAWKREPVFVKLLWLYLPVLFTAYISQAYIIHETRSFWALAPVFTATAAVWFSRPAPDATPPAPQP